MTVTSPQVDARAAIINALLVGPKTPRELRGEVTQLGVPPSTYHYTLRQMIKHGEVEEAKYSYKGQGVSDAVVEELLSPLGEAERLSEPRTIEFSKNLEFLAKKRGIALKPRFLSTIEDCLAGSLADVRKCAMAALSDTLWNLSETPEDKSARQIVNERFFEMLARTAKNDADLDIRRSAVKMLAELGDPRAIDVVMEIVEKATDEQYRELKNSLEQAIVWPYDPNRRPRNYLTRYYHSKVLLRLSKLAAKGNGRASELAAMIRRGAPGI
jgi:hypothetical protein